MILEEINTNPVHFIYLVPVFLLIGFIFGAYRGFKRELSFFIVMTIATCASIFLYDIVKNLMSSFIDFHDVYEKISGFTQYINASEGYLTYFVCGFLIFLIIALLLNGLLYLIFFSSAKVQIKILDKGTRFSGGILGLISGIELSLIMLFFLSGFMKFDVLFIDKISFIAKILSEIGIIA